METRQERPTDNPYVTDPATSFRPVEDLTAAEASDQAEQLREAIRYHDYRYYVRAEPLISDRAYDALFARLETLEDGFDLETTDSPTRRVGGTVVEELETVEHVAPMLSIDQGGEAADVRAFDERVRRGLATTDEGPDTPETYFCEPKFDGLSVEIVYRDGVYERAATRGDGEVGDDVTEQVRTIPTVPLRLRGDYPDFLAVRGEVYMPRDDFQEYNRERIERGDDPFANPRNAAAGTIRQLDTAVVAERPLAVFFFSVLDASIEFESHSQVYQQLPSWGLRVTDRAERVADIEAAIDYRNRLLEQRETLNYELDGVVISVDDMDACATLGATSRAPRWAYAYKFPARSGRTTLRDIVVQVGRTGRLTPVALLDPVDVGGVTVSRANLHNPAEIDRLGVDVGDEVSVQRAGDVIPDVTEVLESNSDGSWQFPSTCPDCGTAVERDGPLAFCPASLGCPAQREQRIEYYASREGLDIEGLGQERIDQLLEADLVADLADLYELTGIELTTLEGWGARSAGNLLEEIEATREPPLPEFITALGIPEVGPTTARELAREFETYEAFREADEASLRGVPDVGPAVATAIRNFFENEDNRAVLDRLLEHVDPQPLTAETGDSLEGETFVFTGALEGITRREAQDLVERHGANATGSVSGNTDYLVVGDDPGQRKRQAAADNDVPTIDETELYELLADRGIEIDI